MGYYDRQLYHHGIPGQKWGDRNGPPYPLDSKEHKEVVERGEKKEKKDRKPMDPNLKKALIVGAGITVGILAAYGGYRLHTIKNHSGGEMVKGLIKKTKEMTADEDMKLVNNGRRKNLFFDFGGHFSNNCQKCSVTYDLRRRGFDVKAGESSSGEYVADLFQIYKGLDKKDPTHYMKMNSKPFARNNAEEIINSAKKIGNNSRGMMYLKSSLGVGHSVVWENTKNGDIILRDCQIGKKFTNQNEIKNYLLKYNLYPEELVKVNDLPIDTNYLRGLKGIEYARNFNELEFGLSEVQGALATAGTASLVGLGSTTYTKKVLDNHDDWQRRHNNVNTRTS